MITLFDLRKNPEPKTVDGIASLFDGQIRYRALGSEEIKACIGCWTCWLKTPGKCGLKDALSENYADYINADKVILLMDTAQGFINHQAKAFIDRTIPHYHPYIEIVNGECHHKARYARYPELYFYFDAQNLKADEEQVIEDYLYRTAYHFRSKAFRIGKNPTWNFTSLEFRRPKNKQLTPNATEKVSKLILYNGSPRLSGSNTAIILSAISDAFGSSIEIRDLKHKKMWKQWASEFQNDNAVIFALPLYVHAMPSHVMAFIEMLQPSIGSLGFIIQQGFPESSQSYYLEAYFERLTKRLQRNYMGTAIKGSGEGLHLQPAKGQAKILAPFLELINSIFDDGYMSEQSIAKLAGIVYLSKSLIVLLKLLVLTGIIQSDWDPQLKKNNAFHLRNDRPYVVKELLKNEN